MRAVRNHDVYTILVTNKPVASFAGSVGFAIVTPGSAASPGAITLPPAPQASRMLSSNYVPPR